MVARTRALAPTSGRICFGRRHPIESEVQHGDDHDFCFASTPTPEYLGRVSALLLLGVLAVVLGAFGWVYFIARSALPQLDGTLKVSGLSAPVRVIRDGHGVPTIEAASLDDLFFAQGFVTAQDRLWQMDMMRRFAAGEISEILGDEFLRHDREQRILGLRVAARKALEVSSEQTRSHFEAYARGVNAYIESQRNRLPIEFRISRYAPRPWTPEDSTLIAAQMVKDLNHYPYRDALERDKILARLGPKLTADLYVNSSWHDRPPTVMRPAWSRNPIRISTTRPLPRRPVDSPWPGWTPARRCRASRARWLRIQRAPGGGFEQLGGFRGAYGFGQAAAFERYAPGAPDTEPVVRAHLGCETSGCGGFDAAGVALPGMPYVIVGHNERRHRLGLCQCGPSCGRHLCRDFQSRR